MTTQKTFTKFETKTGFCFLASSNLDLLEQLRDMDKLLDNETTENFMKKFAERFEEEEDKKLRFDNTENFMEDLFKNNFLELN